MKLKNLLESQPWQKITPRIALIALFFCIAGVISYAPPMKQLPQSVADFVNYMAIIGTLAILVRAATALVSAAPYFFPEGLAWRIMALLVGISVIKYVATDVAKLLEWIHTHPSDALTILAAFFVVKILFSFSIASQLPNNDTACGRYAGIVTALPAIQLKTTERDNRVVAVHEAGHALIYATMDCLPDTFSVKMYGHNVNGSLGRVMSTDLVPSKSTIEWAMLFSLAGQAAEEVLLDEASVGSSGDMVKWENNAKLYLRNSFSSVSFFFSPENEFETAQNLAVFTKLKQGQRALLHQFFTVNKQVLDDLAGAIMDKRELVKNDMAPFFERVLLKDSLPKPKV